MKEIISVIVPIYKGKHHVNRIVSMLETCQKSSRRGIKIELILSNDYPDECLDKNIISELYDIKVYNTEKNQGIHSARVRGLQHSTGDYLLMLDQDDMIEQMYFDDQLSKIQDADMVVCNCIHNGRIFYDERKPLETVICKDKIIGEYNYIVSPGQVLIRQGRVPIEWTENIVTCNGADDWFLWVLIFSQNRKVAINDNVLFTHVVTPGINTSGDSWKMYQSICNIKELVINKGLLNKNDLHLFIKATANIISEMFYTLDRIRDTFYTYDLLMNKYFFDASGEDNTVLEGVSHIAIYGMNRIAKPLTQILERQGKIVDYYIDMNARYLIETKAVYSLHDDLPRVDLVIIALVNYETSIVDELCNKGFRNIISVRELCMGRSYEG